MSKKEVCSLTLGIVLYVTVSPDALAQTMTPGGSNERAAQAAPTADSSDSSDGGLADIIVTARKRTERLQDVPVAVSAYTAAALEATGAPDLTALQGNVPGLTIAQQSAAPATPQVSLRGISFQEVEKSVESGIGITVDGVPLATGQGALLDAFDIERIEVLRGPQGLLFGRNTTGGTINIIRSRPDVDAGASGKFRATYGTFDRLDLDGVMMVPLIEGRLAVKLAASRRTNDGQFYNTTLGRRVGTKDFSDYSISVAARPVDNLDVLLTYERLRDHSDLPPLLNAFTPSVISLPLPGYTGGANSPCTNPLIGYQCLPRDQSRNTTQSFTENPSFLDIDAGTAEVRLKLPSVDLVSVSGYRHSKEDSTTDVSAIPSFLYSLRRPQTYDQYSQELRLESNEKGPFSITAGAFAFYNKYDLTQYSSLDLAAIAPGIPGGFVFLNPANGYAVKLSTRSFAAFFQAEYAFTSSLSLVAGARQTWDRKKIDFTSFAPRNAPTFDRTPDLTVLGPATSQILGKTVKFDELTPKVGLNFKPRAGILLYASYTKGYNAGGFNGRAARAEFIGPFKPETLDSYELGFKSDFLDRRLRVNVAAYQAQMKNKQEEILQIFTDPTTNTPVSNTTTQNVAKARYRGIEAEIAAVPIKGFTLSANGGYLDAEYLDFSANLGQGFVDATNLKLRRTPKYTGALTADYAVDLGGGEFGLNGNLLYVDHFETNVFNDPRGRVPSTTTLNAGVRYAFKHQGVGVQVSVYARNITDKTPINGFQSGNAVGTFVEIQTLTPGRQIGASLQFSF